MHTSTSHSIRCCMANSANTRGQGRGRHPKNTPRTHQKHKNIPRTMAPASMSPIRRLTAAYFPRQRRRRLFSMRWTPPLLDGAASGAREGKNFSFLLLLNVGVETLPGLALFRVAEQNYLYMRNAKMLPAKTPGASVPSRRREVADSLSPLSRRGGGAAPCLARHHISSHREHVISKRTALFCSSTVLIVIASQATPVHLSIAAAQLIFRIIGLDVAGLQHRQAAW
ncbi:hypothetical protein K456DRAFT_728046 [Colletotrichum gloeosporioides 23]|nr:hypothetical protein K456DRAFT_728046 [Colletotrichum gloeosporioides 23]